jgi:hypothetical protein
MELTEDQIKTINDQCPYGQGVFREPFGIPNHIKGLVVYTQWTSADRGGSCWDDEDTYHPHVSYNRPTDSFKVLDLVLKELKSDITYLQFRELEHLIDSNIKTDYGYYGDYTENTIEWIELSKLYEFLAKI